MNTAKKTNRVSMDAQGRRVFGTLRKHFADLSNFGLTSEEQAGVKKVIGYLDAQLLDANCPGSSVCGIAITEIIFAAGKLIAVTEENGGDAFASSWDGFYFQIGRAVSAQCNVIYFG